MPIAYPVSRNTAAEAHGGDPIPFESRLSHIFQAGMKFASVLPMDPLSSCSLGGFAA